MVEVGGVLEIEHLAAGYGEVQVIWDLGLTVGSGEVVALLGANGAGKTTLLKVISGVLRPSGGSVKFHGCELSGLGPEQVVKSGISHIPEGRQLFSGMTVEENLVMGAYTRSTRGLSSGLERIYEIFPELSNKRKRQAGTLSGGEQQMCAVGRGLMSDPKLLLIDELSLGLAPVVVERLVRAVMEVHQQRELDILFVEQDVQLALEVATRAYVMESGRIVKQGASQVLMDDPAVRQAYLGL
ncbi:MAG: ABC transporter ATP-binding protein [Firmicutes bacterium]|nr:ABC transporter ATP-binding protein [Bacillota bacterium]